MKSLLALLVISVPALAQAQVTPELLASAAPLPQVVTVTEADEVDVDIVLPVGEDAFPHSISARMLVVDYGLNSDGAPGISNAIEAAYTRKISDLVSLSAPLKAGILNSATEAGVKHPFVGLDAMAQVGHSMMNDRVRPYVTGGLGVVTEANNGTNAQLPVGAGLRIRVTEAAYVSGQYEFRKSLATGRDNSQFGLGVVFNLGRGKFDPSHWDTDGDGVMDHEDACVDIRGSKRMRGCPDSDGDGLHDAIDDCPLYAGPRADRGCPDADGDGVADPDDACPTEPGVAERNGCAIPDRDHDGTADELDPCPDLAGTLNGCPDSDADGIADGEDSCPTISGPKATGGCPDRDSDGVADAEDACPLLPGKLDGCPDRDLDGYHDGIDACPNIAGEHRGCPEIMAAQEQLLAMAVRSIAFEVASTELSEYARENLNRLAEAMASYPDYKLGITGHADFEEPVPNRDAFSMERARTCAAYLQSIGIKPHRLVLDGIGAGRPMRREGTAEERAINRRVEFDLYEE